MDATRNTADHVNPMVASPSSVSFFKLFSYADRHDYGLMALGILGGLGNGLALPIFYYIFAKILNSFGESSTDPHKSADDIAKYALDLVYIGIATLLCASAEIACWMYTGERQASKWRLKYVQALLSQDVKVFDTDTQMVESISNNMVLVQDSISEKVGILAHFMATCIGGFGVAFVLMWKIGVVTLAFIPAFFLAYLVNAALLKNQIYRGAKWSIVEQTVEHIRTIYAFNYEERAAQLFSGSIPLNLKYGLTKGFGSGIVIGMSFFTFPFFLWYGGLLVRNSQVTGGKALAAIMSAFDSTNILLHAVAITTTFTKGREAVENIIELMNKRVIMSEKGTKLSEVRGDLELQNIAFNYSSKPNNVVLRDVSFSIPSGRTVALVGDRGSGKSTVVSLIARLYDPVKGRILLDGVDIRTLHLGWFRDQIGLVNQEPLLFATSIFNNILYGKEDATIEEVEAAAKAANAHTFIINLPDSYKTQVGDCNVQLSDGQKQRLVIARTLLKNPKLLLVDESIRGLNAASEEKVQSALDRLMVERSTLIIAHRLSTIQSAYTINVLQDGRIVEMGTHNHLTRQNEFGPYSILVKMQEMALGGDGTVLGQTSKAASSMTGTKIKRASGTPTRRNQASNATDVLEETADNDKVAVRVEETSEKRTYKASFWRLLKISTPLWPCVCLGSIGAILTGALLNPVFGFMLGELLQVFYEKDMVQMERDVQKYVLVLVGVGVVAIVIQMVQHYYFGAVAEILGAKVKETIFREALRNEVGWFDLAEKGGKSLKEQLLAVTNCLHILIPVGMAVVLKCMACFITAFTIGFVIEWRLTLVMLAMFPLLVWGTIGQELCIVGFNRVINRAFAHSTVILHDAIRNIHMINASNFQNKIVSLFEEAICEPSKWALFRGKIWSIFFSLSQMTLYCSFGLIFWYGSILVKNGTSDFGSIIKVFMVISTAACEVGGMFGPMLWTANAFTTLDSTFAIVDRQTSINANDSSSEVVESISGSIELLDVEFAYPIRPDVTIFRGLNLSIKAGQRIALVGAKGSGKSSLIALVERFYDPTKGRVMVDGKDIKGLNLHSLRQSIGLVQSDPVLFKTSISENILYGRQGATLSEVQKAAEAAEAHIFIHVLPHGYNAQVGDAGVELSRGQQQRVAIARVVLKDPAILLVDDAAAGLDEQQEKVVNEAIDHLMVDRTTIVVTHNLADICMVVDTICVVERGCIVEQGTHGQLMEAQGSYACLFNIQRARGRRRRPNQ